MSHEGNSRVYKKVSNIRDQDLSISDLALSIALAGVRDRRAEIADGNR
jgi:hypothetical protein